MLLGSLGLLALGWSTASFRVTGREQRLARAQELARAGRFREAGSLLDTVPPGASSTEQLLRAQVAGALDETDAAIAALGKIPDGDPLGPLARLSEGQLEARRGRLRFAEQAFRAAIRLLPGCVQAHRELVYIFSVQRRLDELDEPLEALYSLGALDLKHLIHWGMVRHSQWSAAGDLPALTRYVAADPDDRRSRRVLVEALIRLGRLDEASKELESLRDTGDEVPLRALLAEARQDLGEMDRWLESGPPDDLDLARMRGRRALARRDPDKAARWFRIALGRRPADRTATLGLASSLLLAGDRAGAHPLLERVRRLDALGTLLARAESREGDVDASLARDLGIACAEVGRDHEARAWLQQAIAKDASDALAQQALGKLAGRSPRS